MTLQELRTYYRLREYQITHLLNAKHFHSRKHFDYQMWIYLFNWADAMYEADKLLNTIGYISVIEQSRGQK